LRRQPRTGTCAARAQARTRQKAAARRTQSAMRTAVLLMAHGYSRVLTGAHGVRTFSVRSSAAAARPTAANAAASIAATLCTIGCARAWPSAAAASLHSTRCVVCVLVRVCARVCVCVQMRKYSAYIRASVCRPRHAEQRGQCAQRRRVLEDFAQQPKQLGKRRRHRRHAQPLFACLRPHRRLHASAIGTTPQRYSAGTLAGALRGCSARTHGVLTGYSQGTLAAHL